MSDEINKVPVYAEPEGIDYIIMLSSPTSNAASVVMHFMVSKDK